MEKMTQEEFRRKMDEIYGKTGIKRPRLNKDEPPEQLRGQARAGDAVPTSTGYAPAGAEPTAIKPPMSYKPTDFTDSGNAAVYSRVYNRDAVFVRALGWLVWNGMKWEANDLIAVGLAMKLSGLMLDEAINTLALEQKAQSYAEAEQNEIKINTSKEMIKNARKFIAHAISTRNHPKISRMLELSKPNLHIELDKLDAEPFALNTPAGIVDLRTGKISPHDPKRLCSCITSVAPSDTGMDIWNQFLDVVTCGDASLKEFLQQIMGMAAIGKMYVECIALAYGDGSNGKSTLFNVVSQVLGDYAGYIAPEVLTTDKSNKGADLAELRGKRLVIMAELEEGKRISTSMLKRIASTDRITAEKKYRDPESFIPTHTAVLFTNHLPRIGSNDAGTWRRVMLIPFNAKIPKNTEVKNYADELFNTCGGAVLQWVIDGAVKFCLCGNKLTIPKCVHDATGRYREDNDSLGAFINDCCVVGQTEKVPSGELYNVYRAWAERNGEYIRHNSAFKAGLERRGFESRRTKKCNMWYGIGLKAQSYGTPINGDIPGLPW